MTVGYCKIPSVVQMEVAISLISSSVNFMANLSSFRCQSHDMFTSYIYTVKIYPYSCWFLAQMMVCFTPGLRAHGHGTIETSRGDVACVATFIALEPYSCDLR